MNDPHYNRQKDNISYPLIRIRTCVYQGVRNVSFSEGFAYVLNEWSHVTNTKFSLIQCVDLIAC